MKVARLSLLTVFDQGLFALSNAAATTITARVAGSRGVGDLALLTIPYFLAIGVLRSVVSEPFLVLPAPRGERTSTLAALRAYVVLAIAAGVMCSAVLLVWYPASVGLRGMLLPFLLVQDFVRYLAFKRLRPEVACVSDGLWLVSFLVLVVAVPVDGSSGVFTLWSISGALATAPGLWLLSDARSAQPEEGWPRASRRWFAAGRRRLITWSFVEGSVYTSAEQLLRLVVFWQGSREMLGELRVNQTLCAPLALLVGATSLVSAALESRSTRQRPGMSLAPLGLLAAFVAVGLPLAAAGPGLGRLVFESSQVRADVLLVLASAQGAYAAALVYRNHLRARDRSNRPAAIQGLAVLAMGIAAWVLVPRLGALGGAYAVLTHAAVYLAGVLPAPGDRRRLAPHGHDSRRSTMAGAAGWGG